MRRLLLRLFLRAVGLPRLPPPAVDEAFAPVADRLLRGDARAFDEPGLPRLDFLRWLGEHRDVVFHGSVRGDLESLEPIRLSTDEREFGNRQAVFATDDPIWALWFAILGRGEGYQSTRNASLRLVGEPVTARRYLFAVNEGALAGDRFGPGFLYVLPGETFESEAPLFGALDTSQQASSQAVRPLVRLEVAPSDFPFVDRVVEHRQESIVATMLRFGRFRPRGARRR